MPESDATLDHLERVDAACDRFEAAWRAGREPRVEDYLAAAPPADRAPLLAALLAVEIELRRRANLDTDPDSLRARFPDHADTVAAVCGSGGPARAEVPGYELLGEIGRGAMGVVHRARQARPSRFVALKMILAGSHAGPEAVKRFLAEADLAAQLQHPNIVQVYEAGTAAGLPYFSLELVEGGSLAEQLRGGPLPPAAAARLVEVLARAMDYAHARGIVHRDLKPANVLLTPEREPKVADFGLARGGESTATATGAVVGTPSYMAPEQAEGRKGVGPAADVYALGAILYEMLTGRPPFRGATAVETLDQVRTRDPVPVRALQPGVPRDLETVALTCLRKEPARRYASAGALADDLRRFLDGRAIAARRVGPVEKTVRWARRRPAAAALVGLVLAVVGGGVAAAAEYDRRLVERRVEDVRREGEERDRVAREAAEAQQRSLVERARRTRAADAVAKLLDMAEAGLNAGDADRAAPFLDQATRRAADDAVSDNAPRVEAYRGDLAMLRELDRVDTFRWTPVVSNSMFARYPLPGRVVERWAMAFAAYGIDLRTPPQAEAVARITKSSIRVPLLAALDGCLARVPSEPVRALLAATDPDPFRTEVRRLLAAGNTAGLAALMGRPEWKSQPLGLVRACAAVPRQSVEARRALLVRAAGDRPDDFGLLMDLGETYVRGVSYEDGAGDRWFQAAVALRPAHAGAWYSLGVTLYGKHDWDGAVASLREAVRLDPEHAQSHLYLGLALSSKRDRNGAIAALRDAAKLDTTSFLSHNALGSELRLIGDLDGAIAAYREAIRREPSFNILHYDLWRCLCDKRDWDGAVAASREAVRRDPRSAEPRNWLGVALRGKGDLDGAIAAYRDAIRLGAKYGTAYTNLGAALSAKRDWDGAATAYREAVRLDPKAAAPHTGLGNTLFAKGDLGGAASAYLTAMRLDVASLPPYKLAAVFEAQGDLTELVGAYQEMIRLSPRDADTRIRLGGVYLKLGRTGEALASYRAVLVVEPTNDLALEGLEYCLRLQRGEVPTAPPPREATR